MSSVAVALPTSELVLDRYRPLRPLGSGGSGTVWLSRDERTGLEVALKIVPREGKAALRAEREAEAAARLRHERCLRAYDFGSDSGHVYIAYEYVQGRTLRETLRAGELRDPHAVEAAAQVLDALAHAHGRGVVHRDVKPSNVLLQAGDRLDVRLVDFGLAQFDEADTLTAAGDVPGTLAYIAPERLAGEEASPASDVWAVGVMLWEALAGTHPFWGAPLPEVPAAIMAGAPPLADQRPDLPRRLLAAVDAALAIDPARRPSAAELADALRSSLRRRREQAPARRRRVPVARFASAGAVGAYAGAGAAFLPFFPAGWPLVVAAAAAALGLLRPRAGLAVALAAPLLPLGNLGRGFALLYAAAALCWLAAGRAAPLRAAAAALGIALAVRLDTLGLATEESPVAVAAALGDSLLASPAYAVDAAAVAAAATLLPAARRHGRWGVALLGAGVVAAGALTPHTLALAGLAWAVCLGLWLRDER